MRTLLLAIALLLPVSAAGEEDPFRLPQSWLDRESQLNRETRFNLVANTEIIGGNSGSPVIDGAGRLVGLVFDGNVHSIAGAYWFDEGKNRTVAVHPAVMVETLADVYDVAALLEELGLEVAVAAGR